jgi:hypothetical protein
MFREIIVSRTMLGVTGEDDPTVPRRTDHSWTIRYPTMVMYHASIEVPWLSKENPPFHVGNTGSNPARDASVFNRLHNFIPDCVQQMSNIQPWISTDLGDTV